MSRTLARWNQLPADQAEDEILACCGSRAWARALVAQRPITGKAMLLAKSDQIWSTLREADWSEAFGRHPRIGESEAQQRRDGPFAGERSRQWSVTEQSQIQDGDARVKSALAAGNREYERRFGRTFIVCATGKSAAQILEVLGRRLRNEPTAEFYEAAREQQQITHIRLERWLAE